MADYKLIAKLNGEKRQKTIHGYEQDYGHIDAQFDATMNAIAFIMNEACDDPFWAHAEIKLVNSAGEVIHEMPAKEF